jgi:hypothetical protein
MSFVARRGFAGHYQVLIPSEELSCSFRDVRPPRDENDMSPFREVSLQPTQGRVSKPFPSETKHCRSQQPVRGNSAVISVLKGHTFTFGSNKKPV